MRRPLLLALLGSISVGAAAGFQLAIVAVVPSAGDVDGFFAALAVPQVVISLLGSPLAAVLVPLCSGPDPATARREGASLVGWVAVAGLAIAAVLSVLAPAWTGLLVPGFDPAMRLTTVHLTRILLFGAWAGLAGLAAAAVGQAAGRFVLVESIQAAAGVASLAVLPMVLARGGVEGAAWLWSARMAVVAALLLPFLGKPWGGRGPLREALRRLRPLVFSGGVFRLEPLLDRALTSGAAPGSLALYAVAQQAAMAGATVLQKAVVGPAVPGLARLAASGDEEGFRRRALGLLRLTTLLATGAWVAAAVLAWPVLFALESRQYLRPGDARVLAGLAALLGLSFVAGSAGLVTSSALFSRGDTATPARYGLLTFPLHLLVKVAVFPLFGLAGLAVSAGFHPLANTWLQRRRIVRRGGEPKGPLR